MLLLAAYLFYTRRAQAAPTVTSGTPRPDLTGSQAQTGSGGVSTSFPGDLLPGPSGGPVTLREATASAPTAPDSLTAGVQQADTVSAETPQAIPAATVTSTTPSFGYGINSVTGGVDAQQAFAAAVLGVTPTPNMTLDDLNAQLAAQGLPAQSYPTTIHANAPAQISSTVTAPSPAISDIQRHYVYGRDPEA